MRKKLEISAFLVLSLLSCTSGPRPKTWGGPLYRGETPKGLPVAQETLTFEDLSYDGLWDTCERVLIDFDYVFYTSDKEKGRIVVRTASIPAGMSSVVTKTEMTSDERDIILFFILTQEDVKMSLVCQAHLGMMQVSPGGEPVSQVSGTRQKNIVLNEMARVLDRLKKKLKK
jgi:hypothetical protein